MRRPARDEEPEAPWYDPLDANRVRRSAARGIEGEPDFVAWVVYRDALFLEHVRGEQ